MKIILDSNVYELADCQKTDEAAVEHFNYLENLIALIKKSSNYKIVCSRKEYDAISDLTKHPWDQYEEVSKFVNQFTALPILYNDLLNLIDYNDWSDEDVEPACPLIIINYYSVNGGICYTEFLKHIAIAKDSDRYLIFMGTANHNLTTPLPFQILYTNYFIDVIMDISNEDVIYFSNGYRKMLLYNRDFYPSIAKPLPNADLCEQYYQICKRKVSIGEDKISTYRKIVCEIALRNGYYKNDYLSRINSSNTQIRDIYTSNTNPTVHICTDVRHGTIEVCDSKGIHQGECLYNGNYKSNSKDLTGKHDIKV